MTQMQDAEDRLRRMILDMDVGPGERLTERRMEGQLGASRSSVRTALFRLEAEGLVAREGRAWIVPPLNLGEIAQLFAYREVLEVAAIRRAPLDLISAKIVEVERLLDEAHPDATPEQIDLAGTAFHMWVASLAQNDFITRGVGDALARLQRARWLEADATHHGWDEHRAIVAAIRQTEMDHAVSLLEAHLRETSERLLEKLNASRRTLRSRGVILK
nr:GntR family transcriptional regulator [uncultured Acidocella sp.]